MKPLTSDRSALVVDRHPSSNRHQPVDRDGPAAKGSGLSRKVKDPVCGMMVDAVTALRSEIGGRTFYFCSSGCQRSFEAPDEELRHLKRRVTAAAMAMSSLSVITNSALLKRLRLERPS